MNGYRDETEREIARIISEELNDPRVTWAAIDAAAKRIRDKINTADRFAADVVPMKE